MTAQELLRKVTAMQQQLAEISAALLEPEGLKLPRVRLTDADIMNVADEVSKRLPQSVPATLETKVPGISKTQESRWQEVEGTGPVKAMTFALDRDELSRQVREMGRLGKALGSTAKPPIRKAKAASKRKNKGAKNG